MKVTTIRTNTVSLNFNTVMTERIQHSGLPDNLLRLVGIEFLPMIDERSLSLETGSFLRIIRNTSYLE